MKILETEKKKLEPNIDSVIVYQKGVQITQVGTINLNKGEQIIIISDLPDSLDEESIRVKGIGKGIAEKIKGLKRGEFIFWSKDNPEYVDLIYFPKFESTGKPYPYKDGNGHKGYVRKVFITS